MKECDLVMKGGITSGIVYPKAIYEIHKGYKLKQIGGTSAGAIAAALAGAAEFARQEGGFERLNKLPDDFRDGLEVFFHPYKVHKKLFKKILEIKATSKKDRGIWWKIKTGSWTVWNLRSSIKSIKSMPKTHFGVCPGTNVKKKKNDLINWLNYQIEYISHRVEKNDEKVIASDHAPMTFGDLRHSGITLRLVTTNLSKGIPQSLPFLDGEHYFKISDLDWVVPENVKQWLIKNHSSEREGYVEVPTEDDMPIILALRMSLSFPILFSALPIYTEDNSLREEQKNNKDEEKTLYPNYFSDGGISSNFPIHYFDSVLPSRPTFGISLSSFDSRKHEEDKDEKPSWNRIFMPTHARGGTQYGVNSIEKTTTFASSILNSARNWQDSVQMKLPGYRERIVHVSLTKKEGGLNLDMDEKKINSLIELGELAGKRILDKHPDEEDQTKFSFSDHRWRRVLSTSNALEEFLYKFNSVFNNSTPSGDPEVGSIKEFLENLKVGESESYEPGSQKQIDILSQRLRMLDQAASYWVANDHSKSMRVPKPESTFRILAKWMSE